MVPQNKNGYIKATTQRTPTDLSQQLTLDIEQRELDPGLMANQTLGDIRSRAGVLHYFFVKVLPYYIICIC